MIRFIMVKMMDHNFRESSPPLHVNKQAIQASLRRPTTPSERVPLKACIEDPTIMNERHEGLGSPGMACSISPSTLMLVQHRIKISNNTPGFLNILANLFELLSKLTATDLLRAPIHNRKKPSWLGTPFHTHTNTLRGRTEHCDHPISRVPATPNTTRVATDIFYEVRSKAHALNEKNCSISCNMSLQET